MSDPMMPPTTPMSYDSAGAMSESDPAQRSQAMIAHLLGILGILGTGIYYLIKKNDPTAGPFVRGQMKEVLNWELFLTIAIFAFYIVAFILIMVTKSAILATLIGLVMMVVSIGNIVLVVMAGLKANKGQAATYPTPIRLIK